MPSSTKQPSITSPTLRNPSNTYLHLSLITTTTSQPPLDTVTILSYLRSALSQYLGLHGTAIPIDVLKVDDEDAYIRMPYDDGSAVVAAVSQWQSRDGKVALRVKGRSAWLGGLIGMSSSGKRGDKLWTLEM